MRKLNRILLLFLLVVVAALVVIWQFVQSDTFGKSVSNNLNRVTKSQFGVSVNFENLDFQLFPPGANLNQVELQVNRQDAKGSAHVSKLGLYFNLLDTFRTKLTVKEFYLEDAVIQVETFQGGEQAPKETQDSFDLNKTIRDAQENLPFNIDKALLRDVQINIGPTQHFINLLSVRTTEEALFAKGDLRNIDLGKYITTELLLDQVTFDTAIKGDIIELRDITLHQGVNSLSGKGKVSEYIKKPHFDVEGMLIGELSELHRYIDFREIGELRRGALAASFKAKGNLEKYQVDVGVDLDDFDTDFVHGDKLLAKLRINEKGIIPQSIELKEGLQNLALEKPFTLYSFSDKKFARRPFGIIAERFSLNNALSYIQKTLSPLKGLVTGKIEIAFSDNGVRFFSDDKLEIENLLLQFGAGKPILGSKKVELVSPTFNIVDGVFSMDAGARIDETEFRATGLVGEGKLNFSVRDGKISLEELAPYAGFGIKGRGKFDLDVKNGGILEIASDLIDFDFEGFHLGKASSRVLFNFADSSISVHDLVGEQGKAAVIGEALINYENLNVNAKGRLSAKRYKDIKDILHPVLGKLEAIPNDLYGNWNLDFQIGGKATLEDLIVNGIFEGKNNYVYNESFEKINFDLELARKNFRLKDIVAMKSTGVLKGGLEYSLIHDVLSYNLAMEKLPLSDITNFAKTPFAFDGTLSGTAVGESKPGYNNILADIRLQETHLAGTEYPDSGFSLALTEKELDYHLNLLGEELLLKGKVQLGNSKLKSNGKLFINSPDVKVPLSLLKFVDLGSLELEGAVKLSALASFEGVNFQEGDLSINLERLLLKKGTLEIDHVNRGPAQVLVDRGQIKRWDLELKGNRAYLVSKGTGALNGNYDIDNRMKADAGVLEAFNNIIAQSSGTVRAKVRFFKNYFNEDYEAVLLGDNVSVSSGRLPTAITDSNFKLSYKDKRLDLEKMDARLASGELSAGGHLLLKGLVPELDFRLAFKDAGFPILKKSNLVVSGNAHLSGNKLPYSLTGEVKIQKLLLMNEITDFAQGRDKSFAKDFDYLPEQVSTTTNNFVNMNVAVETIEPIVLNNSLADVGVVGNAQVVGGEEDFKVVGKFALAPRGNKIFFKSNEYILTKANIFFYERNKVTNPELDIAAYSVINDYKVNIKVYGPVDNFKMELSSEPALSQEDVLSLIAFGYTEDLSSNLSEREKESMTRAGVGSIIFDSFKINETLKNEFGLQVNLGTQIQEENRSYLSRVNADSSVGKVSSATTIEVKKQLSDALNLSVSSTVGGSVGQRQSMNLNYNITNKLSVEGVYETRTSDDGEETINDSSLGADVKIRWSFR